MLLALDTSTRMIGVALYDGVQVLGEMAWISKNHHTIELGPAIEMSLARGGISIEDINGLGVAIGPGSFTGLRIGLAFAKGLAFTHNLPLVGIPTLDVLAKAQPVIKRKMAAVLRAGRRRLAVGWYKVEAGEWISTGDLENLALDELVKRIRHRTYICGELTAEGRSRLGRKYKNVILASPAQSIRRPAFLAELAWKRLQEGQTDDPSSLAPIYLHQGEPIPG
jgi:tRNA threonylcarbamoyladenosine biosynthesis protein TsaB